MAESTNLPQLQFSYHRHPTDRASINVSANITDYLTDLNEHLQDIPFDDSDTPLIKYHAQSLPHLLDITEMWLEETSRFGTLPEYLPDTYRCINEIGEDEMEGLMKRSYSGLSSMVLSVLHAATVLEHLVEMNIRDQKSPKVIAQSAPSAATTQLEAGQGDADEAQITKEPVPDQRHPEAAETERAQDKDEDEDGEEGLEAELFFLENIAQAIKIHIQTTLYPLFELAKSAEKSRRENTDKTLLHTVRSSLVKLHFAKWQAQRSEIEWQICSIKTICHNIDFEISRWLYEGDEPGVDFMNSHTTLGNKVRAANDNMQISEDHMREAKQEVETAGAAFTQASRAMENMCAWEKISSKELERIPWSTVQSSKQFAEAIAPMLRQTSPAQATARSLGQMWLMDRGQASQSRHRASSPVRAAEEDEEMPDA